MPRSSLSSVHLDVSEESQKLQAVDPDAPFLILVAGDFSGGASRVRKPIEIDRDNFDQVMAVLSPEVRLSFASTEVAVRFRELDDFHPDRLFEQLAPFQALRDLRRKLSDSSTFAATAAQLAPPEPPRSVAAAPAASGADLLSQMIGESPRPARPEPARSDWDRMLQEIVAPYAVPKPDRRQPEWIAQTDAAITGEMRSILHQRRFQELEAAWRGLYFLVRRLETGESLKVFVWDLPLSELTTAEGQAMLRRVTVDETVGTPGGAPWSVIAGLYWFSPEQEPLLAQIAGLARRATAPFVSGVAPDVVGLKKVFEGLRRTPDAHWVGLVLPRFLLRLPYGSTTDSTERFDFEEMPDPPEHERYLWGHPAIACAYLLGEAFTRSGWSMRPGQVSEISGLPAHVYKVNGAPELKPCAEVLLTEDAAMVLLERGLMPLASIKGSDRARLVRFQSIADPVAALAGRWS